MGDNAGRVRQNGGRAADIFARSELDEKRQLIAFVYSNLQLRGKKLDCALRSPFDLMADRPDYASWLAFLDTVRTERFEEIHEMSGAVQGWLKAA